MKPPPFDYRRPVDLSEALALLADESVDVKVLAGGQSLVPMLNLRLARPEVLVDISRLDLADVAEDGSDLVVGALVTHRRVETDRTVRAAAPLFAQAARHIGHLAIRERGTIGGSIAHADSSAEFSLCAVATGATLVAASVDGRRTIPAEEFFLGPFSTALEPAELLVEVRIPRPDADRQYGFAELARRSGDFALAAAGVSLAGRGGGSSRVVVVGASPAPALVERDLGDLGRADLAEVATELVEELPLAGDTPAFLRRAVHAVVTEALGDAVAAGTAGPGDAAGSGSAAEEEK